MGRLIMTPSYLTKFSWNFIGIAALLFLMRGESGILVSGQNCDFIDVDVDKSSTDDGEWIITGDSVSEYTPGGANIWDVSTENIQTSSSHPIPHGQYLTGLRYSRRYVYQATDAFKEFVKKEKAIAVHRNVTFKCADGVTQRVHFIFPLIDENEPPRFIEQPSQDLQVNLGTVKDDTILNEGKPITVFDGDFEEKNTDLSIATDRRELLIAELVEDKSKSNTVGKTYNVNLYLNLTTNPINTGRYTVNLICRDWQYTTSIPVGINLFK